jgi:conjugal transfer/entry exclusion protein
VAAPPDAATQSAEDGMDDLAGDQNDLATAENASDDAPGDLAAAQAGHRIEALQVSDSQKMRQFLYAQQVQKADDEADAEAWMTLPDGPEDY